MNFLMIIWSDILMKFIMIFWTLFLMLMPFLIFSIISAITFLMEKPQRRVSSRPSPRSSQTDDSTRTVRLVGDVEYDDMTWRWCRIERHDSQPSLTNWKLWIERRRGFYFIIEGFYGIFYANHNIFVKVSSTFCKFMSKSLNLEIMCSHSFIVIHHRRIPWHNRYRSDPINILQLPIQIIE